MGRIKEFLEQREKEHLLRILHPAESRREGRIYFKDKEYLDFSSNDYLGLSQHPQLKEAAVKAALTYGISASASRLLSGDSQLIQELEKRIAQFKQKESALVFNSGYQANLGIISALFKKDDVIFSDRLNHASIIDGIRLSGAKLFRFPHNDFQQLESLLLKERSKFQNSLIITESVFSMDGDRAPLKELARLAKQFNCQIMVDEAHATGIFGQKGSGLVEEENLAQSIDFIMGTFSKALGSFGAYLACSIEVKKYLINTCRSFIYSTALPPSVIAANLASLGLIEKEAFRRKRLLDNADYFRKALRTEGFKVKGSSQIIPLILESSQEAVKISQRLQDKGYWVLPIRPPTVPKGESRLRFSLTYYHSREVLTKLINDIVNLKS